MFTKWPYLSHTPPKQKASTPVPWAVKFTVLRGEHYWHNNNSLSLTHMTVKVHKIILCTVPHFYYVAILVLPKDLNTWLRGHEIHNFCKGLHVNGMDIIATHLVFLKYIYMRGKQIIIWTLDTIMQFYTFLLYGHICSALWPEPLTYRSWISQVRKVASCTS